MISPSRGRLLRNAIVPSLGGWIVIASTAVAHGDGPACRVPGCKRLLLHTHDSMVGTLGYGPPGDHPGFQGFGLGYHPGYGYGGNSLGVGSGGGYPHYGGPGYPHCSPTLRRLGTITRFTYYGGPGYPTPSHPHFYGPTGPLVAEKPVIDEGPQGGDYDVYRGYGGFTGVIPYPEQTFASFTTAAGRSLTGSGVPPSAPATRSTTSDANLEQPPAPSSTFPIPPNR